MRTLLLYLMTVGLLGAPSVSAAACNIVDGIAHGDCAGVVVNTSPRPALEVSGFWAEGGMVEGATVLAGGYLILSGISTGDIHVHPGGRLRVSGTVSGTVFSAGDVQIDGMASAVVATGGKVSVSGVVGRLSGSADFALEAGSVAEGVVR